MKFESTIEHDGMVERTHYLILDPETGNWDQDDYPESDRSRPADIYLGRRIAFVVPWGVRGDDIANLIERWVDEIDEIIAGHKVIDGRGVLSEHAENVSDDLQEEINCLDVYYELWDEDECDDPDADYIILGVGES